MPPERARVLAEWMEKASNDLRVCEILLSTQPCFTEAAAFHAQQAAEKSLKAYLTFLRLKFGKIHDIGKLGELILPKDSNFQPLLERAKDLTPFAANFRYPGEDRSTPPTSMEVKKLHAIAKNVYEEVLKRIPKESDPANG